MIRLIYIVVCVLGSMNLSAQKIELEINPKHCPIVIRKDQRLVSLDLTIRNLTDSIFYINKLSKDIYSIPDDRAKEKYLRYRIVDKNKDTPEYNIGLLNSPVQTRQESSKSLNISPEDNNKIKIRIDLSGYNLEEEVYSIKLYYFEDDKQISISNEVKLQVAYNNRL